MGKSAACVAPASINQDYVGLNNGGGRGRGGDGQLIKDIIYTYNEIFNHFSLGKGGKFSKFYIVYQRKPIFC